MLTMIGITFREGLNRKVLLISLVLAAIFLGLYGTGVHYAAKSFNESPNPMLASVVYPQLLSFGLYFGGFIVSFLAIFSTVGAISSEIETGIIQAIITKPLRRRDYVLGKFLGLGLFLALYSAVFFTVIALIINLKTGLVLEGQWKALGLFALQPVVLLAITLYGSVVFPTIANGVVMFMLYAVAIIGGMVEQIGWLINNAGLQQAGIVTSLVMPVDSLYRKIVHLLLSPADNPLNALQQMGPFGSMAEPSVWMVVYALLYVVFFTGLAVYSFNRKDI
ncbi:ABC transporter permease [Desulfoscipio geothermicus]|uniref:ABC-type transport system involved in multi-copper enzyme maturation, permease component n=1 Tax=Desulfoscipio geothermicus DSM 3669 TaxID=1121426 RepID=A0A1I6DIL4_9FIRM|nr:ABC transporter permease subunit [Desulfoscipio geothermicus]SFR05192.1 ABC-type transport system involved in multi-copper enzyme maturation, permease component [Desulfoscipio geothermicus DSM 3669]